MALGKKSVVYLAFLFLCLALLSCLDLAIGHKPHSHSHSGFCGSDAHHHCEEHHHHDHDHDHDHHHRHAHDHKDKIDGRSKLPEELAEEEDMKLYGFGFPHEHDHHDTSELSGLGLWLNALGCSFLVSMASLTCLIVLPVIFVQGKPSKAVVDSLALFGAGAMLGDAFLHQLPHAFASMGDFYKCQVFLSCPLSLWHKNHSILMLLLVLLVHLLTYLTWSLLMILLIRVTLFVSEMDRMLDEIETT